LSSDYEAAAKRRSLLRKGLKGVLGERAAWLLALAEPIPYSTKALVGAIPDPGQALVTTCFY
jgi:hypothetical protein